MRPYHLSTRLTVGLTGVAAIAALVAPAASNAAVLDPATNGRAVTASVPTRAVLPSIPGKQLVVVERALAGMARPAAPAALVVAIDKKSAADFGRHEVKQGYVNVEQAAWQSAGAGAAGGAAVGALAGAIASALITAVFSFPLIFTGVIPYLAAIAVSAIGGAIFGAVWGAVGGGVGGYINGRNQAIAHNNAVKANNGQPVSARVKVAAPAPLTVDSVARQARTTVDNFARQAHRDLRKAPNLKLPPSAHRSIDDAKRGFARHFGIPTPKKGRTS